MPYPVQLGAVTDRLRNFFRLRGKTSFMLDEVIVPVTLVQDLTKGPYQAGVVPFAGTVVATMNVLATNSVAFVLEPKAGSVTPDILALFKGRSFSLTWLEFQNDTTGDVGALQLHLVSRAAVVALGVPDAVGNPLGIQQNHLDHPPLQANAYNTTAPPTSLGSFIWGGRLGDNLNTTGSRREYEPEPNITIGPDDALLLLFLNPAFAGGVTINFRGFYQAQPS